VPAGCADGGFWNGHGGCFRRAYREHGSGFVRS
jgi:hypothetical protein